MSGKTHDRRGRQDRELAEILRRGDHALRESLEKVERELGKVGLAERLSKLSDLPISRLEMPGCVYVVTRVPTASLKRLSRRQRQVAELVLVRLMPKKTVARKLGLSPGTVRTHLDRAYGKMESPVTFLRQLTLLG